MKPHRGIVRTIPLGAVKVVRVRRSTRRQEPEAERSCRSDKVSDGGPTSKRRARLKRWIGQDIQTENTRRGPIGLHTFVGSGTRYGRSAWYISRYGGSAWYMSGKYGDRDTGRIRRARGQGAGGR